MGTFKKFAVAAFIVASVTGCSFLQGVKDSTPARQVYNAHVIYSGALAAAVAYESIPRCTAEQDAKTDPCSSPEVVARLRQADRVAKPLLDQAQQLVRGGLTGGALKDAAAVALAAVKAFQVIVTEEVING